MWNAVFSAGRQGEEDEEHGGADEGDRALAAQRQTAAQREGRSAEGTGRFRLIFHHKSSRNLKVLCYTHF